MSTTAVQQVLQELDKERWIAANKLRYHTEYAMAAQPFSATP